MSAISSAVFWLRYWSSVRVSGRSVNAAGSSNTSAITISTPSAATQPAVVRASARRRSRTTRSGASADAASRPAPSMPAPVVRHVVSPPEVSVRIAVSTEKTRFLPASTTTPASASRSSSRPLRRKRPNSSAATSSSTSAAAVSFATCSDRFWYAGSSERNELKSSVSASPAVAVSDTMYRAFAVIGLDAAWRSRCSRLLFALRWTARSVADRSLNRGRRAE